MAEIAAANNTEANQRKVTVRSSVGYPYFDLNDSLQVARLIHEEAGGACGPDQLAAYLKYKSTKSGTYQTRVSAAKQFGFIKSDGNSISVTDRAMKILSPVIADEAIDAKADAFLSVELFAKVFEKFKGTTIPPKVGMRNLLCQTYGISQERVDPAVRVLFDSAEQAGFFLAGGDNTRLIRPARKNGESQTPAPAQQAGDLQDSPTQQANSKGGGDGEGPTGIHPALLGLLKNLPAVGQTLGPKRRAALIAAFTSTINFIYPEQEDDE